MQRLILAAFKVYVTVMLYRPFSGIQDQLRDGQDIFRLLLNGFI